MSAQSHSECAAGAYGFDIELACELRYECSDRTRVFDFRSAKNIENIPWLLNLSDALRVRFRYRYVLRELRRVPLRLGGATAETTPRHPDLLNPTFRQRRNIQQRLCDAFRGHGERPQCSRLNLSLEIGIVGR